jgi:hypothetical protein
LLETMLAPVSYLRLKISSKSSPVVGGKRPLRSSRMSRSTAASRRTNLLAGCGGGIFGKVEGRATEDGVAGLDRAHTPRLMQKCDLPSPAGPRMSAPQSGMKRRVAMSQMSSLGI